MIKIEKKVFRYKSLTDRKNYTIQSNFCKRPLKTTKKEYFSNLDTKKVTDNITVWRTVVPPFLNKIQKVIKLS